MKLLSILRANTWWNIIVPQVLGWVYFSMMAKTISWPDDIPAILFFFISLVSVSAFGYLFNDYCDEESDRISGKENLLSRFDNTDKLLFLIVPLGVGVISWIQVKANLVANVFFSLQLLALVFYSLPPIRLKNRAMAGVFADAFYGHVNPVIITLCTFFFDEPVSFFQWMLLTVVIAGTSLKGIRNIILHQIYDRKSDRKAGTHTLVTAMGAICPLRFINRMIPLEIVLAILLTGFMSIYFPPFFLTVILFLFVTFLKFSGWRLMYIPKRQLLFKFIFFLNDFYEGWLPVFLLVALSFEQSAFLLLLFLHLVLFPSFLLKIKNDIRTIQMNLKSEENY